MRDVFNGLIERICLVWVDDVVIWRQTMEQLISHLELVLTGLEECSLFVAANKALFYRD